MSLSCSYLRSLPGLAGLLALVALQASPAGAFFQKTELNGTLGRDIGGVWLAVHDSMPEFRVRLEKGSKTANFSVGPLPEDLRPLFGDFSGGVVITAFADPKEGEGAKGIFVGDVVVKINTNWVEDLASYKKAMAEVKEVMYVTLRRPLLKQTTARVIKIKYETQAGTVEGRSALVSENVEFRVLENTLPFAEELQASRSKHRLWAPSEQQLEQLAGNWFRLPFPARPPFIRGEHKITPSDSYDSTMRQDPGLEDTLFSVLGTLEGNPITGGGGKQVFVYGVREASDTRLSGTYVVATLASAPFPISIEYKGVFTMIRFADYSDKDVDFLMSERKKKASDKPDENVELAPDVPEHLR